MFSGGSHRTFKVVTKHGTSWHVIPFIPLARITVRIPKVWRASLATRTRGCVITIRPANLVVVVSVIVVPHGGG